MDGNGRSCKDTSDGKLGGSGDSGEGLGDQGLGEKERITFRHCLHSGTVWLLLYVGIALVLRLKNEQVYLWALGK